MATAKKAKTVTVQDRNGNDVEVPVGIDGKNPVSAQNPAPKTMSEEDAKAQVDFLKNDLPAEATDNNANV